MLVLNSIGRGVYYGVDALPQIALSCKSTVYDSSEISLIYYDQYSKDDLRMQSRLLNQYTMLARRWAWLIVLGIVICGGVTYVISKRIPSVYQATATVIINVTSSTSTFDNVSASEQIAPTYAQLITSPQVLRPVLVQHPGLLLNQLSGMVTAKFQPNTALIEIDVTNRSPDLAMQIANQIGQSFAYYANTQLPGSVQLLPAEMPTVPLSPKPLTYAGIGALVGLGLAVSLIVIFEWIDDRLALPEELEDLLGIEVLTTLPLLSRKQRLENVKALPALAEKYRMACANLNAAQAVKPFKLVMITSALPGEGKSTVAANLASFLAMTDKRVLLIDADMRHPTLDRHFHLDNDEGLSIVIQDSCTQLNVNTLGQETDIPQLRVITAGESCSNAAELLQLPLTRQLFEHFKEAPFDYVIFDSSPLLPVADAQILSSYVEATVLIIDASKTSRRAMRRARHLLNRTRSVMTVGVIINKGRWSDYSESRPYLSANLRSRKEITMAAPPKPPAVVDAANSDPDPDPAVTVVVRRVKGAGVGKS
jgi:polysaccharide biosynthesis transport protein